MSIQKHTDLNFKKINYEKPEKQGLIYYAPINYNNEPFYLQTPKMICKNNSSDFLDKKNPNLDMETMNMDFSFYDFLLNFDENNVKETYKNNKEWFDKDIPLEIIDNMYKRACRPVKKDKKPLFSFKLPKLKDKIQCQIYDQNNVCIDITKLTPDCELIFVLHIRGLKFLKQHYYCDCYVSQIKVFIPRDEKYNVFDTCVIEDDETKEDDIDIIDDEILNEMKEKEIEENLKIEKKKDLETQILELKKQLDNL